MPLQGDPASFRLLAGVMHPPMQMFNSKETFYPLTLLQEDLAFSHRLAGVTQTTQTNTL
jgi:hypothetical protein